MVFSLIPNPSATSAVELKVRFQRKEGELLKKMKDKGELKRGQPKKELSGGTIFLSDLNITPDESSQVQAIASMPPEKFEETISATKEAKVIQEMIAGGFTDITPK